MICGQVLIDILQLHGSKVLLIEDTVIHDIGVCWIACYQYICAFRTTKGVVQSANMSKFVG